LDGGIDVRLCRERDLGRLAAGRGVVNGAAAAGRPGDGAAADPMVDLPELGGSFDRLGHWVSVTPWRSAWTSSAWPRATTAFRWRCCGNRSRRSVFTTS